MAVLTVPLEQTRPERAKNLSLFQLFNLSAGIIGLQFAWSMQIALSSRILEPLGADPFLFGLIWCAGPITGLLIQPLIGAWSDRCWTRLGRRRPFVLAGALLGAMAIFAFPFAPTLLIAALLTWVIDACLNTAQGPYRALVPDNAPPQQHAVANSFINFAFGAGSVIALGVAPLLKAFNIAMSVEQQYIFASLALVLTITYASLSIRETRPASLNKPAHSGQPSGGILDALRRFASGNREIHKLCGIQFITWVGLMCMYIYLTPFVVHHVYGLPDTSTSQYKQLGRLMETADAPLLQQVNQVSPQLAMQPLERLQNAPKVVRLGHYQQLKALESEAVNTAQLALVAYNLVALLLTIPMGYLCARFGKKRLYSLSLLAYSGATAFAFWIHAPWQVIAMMAVAGIGGATILSLPYAMLCEYLPEGDEGTLMGIFNVFVCAPQLISALVIGKIIGMSPLQTALGETHQWWIAFAVSSIFVFLSMLALQAFKERFPGRVSLSVSAGH